MLNLITIGYNSGKQLYKCVKSFEPDNAFIAVHSIHADTVESAQDLCAENEHVSVLQYGINRGVAKSWNTGIRFFQEKYPNEGVLIVNDDITIRESDVYIIKKFIEKHKSEYDIAVMRVKGYNDDSQYIGELGYSCFYLTPSALYTVGLFDENFYPAYYEDIDYDRRVVLSGLSTVVIPTTNIIHAGSNTIKNNPLLRDDIYTKYYPANEAYYTEKWGGKMGNEKYKTPFNK